MIEIDNKLSKHQESIEFNMPNYRWYDKREDIEGDLEDIQY